MSTLYSEWSRGFVSGIQRHCWTADFIWKTLPGTDQADFAPRLKAPTLLIAGKFDWIFGGKDALLRMLGAPAADKKVVLLDTAHDVSEERVDMTREVLAWLDKYLGKIK